MTEPASYDLPDPKIILDQYVLFIKDQEKVFDPVVSTRFVRHALHFIAQRIGEEPPESIKTLEQLAEYLTSLIDKYATPYCAFMYAQYKTENEHQGRPGAATRIAEMAFHRRFWKTPKGEAKNIDLDEIIANTRQATLALKLSPKEFGYKKNGDGGVDFMLPNCYFKEGCRQAFNEGLLKRLDGGMYCNFSSTLCQYLKVVTGYEWDYDCHVFDKPHCITRCYMF